MRKYAQSISIYMIIFIVITFGLIATQLNDTRSPSGAYTYGQLLSDIPLNQVDSLELQNSADSANTGKARVTLKSSRDVVRVVDIPSMNEFISYIHANGSPELIHRITTSAPPQSSFLVQIIPPFIIMIMIIFFLMFVLQQMQGGGNGGGRAGGRMVSFGKSRAKITIDDKRQITFENVAGLDEEKAELQEVVDFLKNAKKYVDIGARIPKGILLVGPPGTGKTYLAKAVSGEAGRPFFSISGSDFVEMFVGVGASRVRDLFEQAKKNSPCIIFIDEIDAVGRRRGAGVGGGHDEREQTLNQLLVEMDGFGMNEGIIIIAATNRPDILDPALLRPGRFDRQVVVGRPDIKAREAVLQIHAKGKKIAEDVDLRVVAQTTAGFTPADLENLLNEAALLSARSDKKEIDMEELRKAFVKVGVGTEKKSQVISDKDKRITAYHEAGHAILYERLSELDPVHIISVIPTGMAGGYTMSLPADDKNHISKKFMEQRIIALLGGRAAEYIVLKDITTGASNDIERATAIARNMVTKYGMSDLLGPIQFGNDNEEVFIGRDLAHTRNYGEDIATKIDTEIKRIVETCYQEAVRIIEEDMDILHKTADFLVKNEKMTGDEFRAIVEDLPVNSIGVELNKVKVNLDKDKL